MERPWIPYLEFFSFLKSNILLQSLYRNFSSSVAFRIVTEDLLQAVLHRACRSSDSFSQGLRLGKLETVQEDKCGLQLQIFSHACQIGSQQIFQTDCWRTQRIRKESKQKMPAEKGKICPKYVFHSHHLELLFFTVLAFPKASNTGLDWKQNNLEWWKHLFEADKIRASNSPLILVVQHFSLQYLICLPWMLDISWAFWLSLFFQLRSLHWPKWTGFLPHLSSPWYIC